MTSFSFGGDSSSKTMKASDVCTVELRPTNYRLNDAFRINPGPADDVEKKVSSVPSLVDLES